MLALRGPAQSGLMLPVRPSGGALLNAKTATVLHTADCPKCRTPLQPSADFLQVLPCPLCAYTTETFRMFETKAAPPRPTCPTCAGTLLHQWHSACIPMREHPCRLCRCRWEHR